MVDLHHIDCMEFMATQPDKSFDLAVVDPPFGSGDKITTGGTWAKKYKKKDSAWNIAPGEEYFKELFRVAKNQIVWGGNYFSLPGTRCFLVWRKISISETFSMAMAEYAWTSFDANAKVIDLLPVKGNRFHPTQKPVKLYQWIFDNYAEKGQRIFDSHLGSGSSAIAAHYAGLDFVGCELDKDYFEASKDRVDKCTRQQTLF